MAEQFNVSRYKLRRRRAGIGPPGGKHANNARLSATQEEGLYRYIVHLDNLNLFVTKSSVSEAANRALQRLQSATSETVPQVGIHWPERCINPKTSPFGSKNAVTKN